jgi:YVTN family beta-propeller protein
MKQLKQNPLFIVLALCAVLASCSKKDNPVVITPINTGLFVLNQGAFNGKNSTLTYYDFTSKAATTDIFANLNGRGLGDTGNDIEIYGSKTYITVNVSSTLEVINTKTGKSLAQLSFIKGTVPSQTRWVTFYKNNAFVTAYDGTVSVIDTSSLTVTKTINVGADPEQMAVSNGKLYVANSGGLQIVPSNTVSVIDLASLTVTKTLTVGINPLSVAADAYGEVYVTGLGNYGNNNSTITVINTTTDVAAAPVLTPLAYGSPFVISGDIAYYFGLDNKIKTYNVKTKTAVSTGFVSDATSIVTPYALTVNDATGEVYVADAGDYKSNGKTYAFDKNGKLEYSFQVGLIPGKIAIVK